MAFNPFHWFRKRQKTFLAGLAIFCMFIFIGQFGSRFDAFDRLLSLFGGGRGGQDKTEVIRLYGKPVTLGELVSHPPGILGVKFQREFAQSFILAAVGKGQNECLQQLSEDLPRLDEPFGSEMKTIFDQLRATSFSDVGEIQKALNQVAGIRRDLLAKDPPKIEPAKELEKFSRILQYQLWLRNPQDYSYFGGSFKTDGLLDFLVWKHEADRLGIHLTETDVKKALNEECLSDHLFVDDPRRDAEQVVSLMKRTKYQYNLEPATIFQILGDEFRVRMAKMAVLGVEPGALRLSNFATGEQSGPRTRHSRSVLELLQGQPNGTGNRHDGHSGQGVPAAGQGRAICGGNGNTLQ